MLRRIYFAQHGWADTTHMMRSFGRSLAGEHDLIVATALGHTRIWMSMAGLMERVEADATEAIAANPDAPIRIIGHSIGGLIWLEILERHPEWQQRVEGLALLGSPVRGTPLGLYLDLRGRFIGRDLKADRSAVAERIAAATPTLTIAGDLVLHTDGVISVGSTRFAHTRRIVLPRVSHAGLRWSGRVRRLVGAFFDQPYSLSTDVAAVISRFAALPGLTQGHARLTWWGRPILLFRDGCTVRVLHRPFGERHLFVADQEGNCLYAACTAGVAPASVDRAFAAIRRDFAAQLI
jgi:pimeloyl-ACP methyl ester carboxylesterase